jgi:hypothetical protein
VPTSFSLPSSTIYAGQTLTATWTVENQGNGQTNAASWNDAVYRSNDAVFDVGDTLITGAFNHTPALAASGTYTNSQGVNISAATAPGNYFLILRTDSDSQVNETNETNNAIAFAITVTKSDLVPTSFTVPANANPSQIISVSWTVENQGNGQTPASSWDDAIYRSTDPVFDGGDTFLTFFNHAGALTAAANYSNTQNVTIPAGTGNFYLILRTDSGLAVAETSEANNTFAAPIVVGLPGLRLQRRQGRQPAHLRRPPTHRPHTHSDADGTPETPTITPTQTPMRRRIPRARRTATPTSLTITLTTTPEADHYVGYKIKAPAEDTSGAPIPGNVFPENWVITIDDVHITGNDDPENILVRKGLSLLNTAMTNDEPGPVLPDRHYLRYAAMRGTESIVGVTPPFEKPAKHVKRIWDLGNELGAIKMVSSKLNSIWVPANADLVMAPTTPQMRRTLPVTASRRPGHHPADARQRQRHRQVPQGLSGILQGCFRRRLRPTRRRRDAELLGHVGGGQLPVQPDQAVLAVQPDEQERCCRSALDQRRDRRVDRPDDEEPPLLQGEAGQDVHPCAGRRSGGPGRGRRDRSVSS